MTSSYIEMASLFHGFQINQDLDLLWQVTQYVIVHIIPTIFHLNINSIGNTKIILISLHKKWHVKHAFEGG